MKSPYYDVIAEAVGVRDYKLVEAIEETMRQDIFHSTLDWQTREQLIQAARNAYAMWREENGLKPSKAVQP